MHTSVVRQCCYQIRNSVEKPLKRTSVRGTPGLLYSSVMHQRCCTPLLLQPVLLHTQIIVHQFSYTPQLYTRVL